MRQTPWLATRVMNQGSTERRQEQQRRRRRSQRKVLSLPLPSLPEACHVAETRFRFRCNSSAQDPCSNCILFIPIISRAMQKTELVPVSLVEKPPTSDATAPTPGGSRSLTSLPNSSHRPQNPVIPDVDLKDEYLSFTDNFANSQEIFTDDYYEYEQGQKEILVKSRLKNHVQFWRDIGANQFILDTIQNGYKIPFFSLPDHVHCRNNRSALYENDFVTEAIKSLLDRGLIVKCTNAPHVVNPLTVSCNNNGKKRLILDLRKVNLHVWKQSVKYEDLRLALMYIKKDCWMIKFDITSAYHFVDIFLPHTDYLGFAWEDYSGILVYYKFLVLPFGLSSACYIYTKLMRPLIAKWRGEGKKIIMFLDDGFGTAETYDKTVIMSREIKSDLLLSGLVPKVDKSCWEPVQELQWLGSQLNTANFTRYGSEVDGLPEVLAEKVSLLPELLKVTKAENTHLSYKRGFNRWRRWGYANGLSSGDALPAKAFQVALYLASIIQTASSASPIINAFYSIKYYHDLFDYVSPTDSRLVINMLEAAKRRLAKPVNKKEPMTVDLLQQMYTHMYVENDVMNQRFICICLLSYAGFLRSAEVLKLRRSDVCINSSYLSVFIESSKTDKFREGAWVLIARTGTQLCPVVNLQKYLTWTDFSSESECYLFRRLSSTKCGHRLRQETSICHIVNLENCF
ncbi:uncharacterized protein LOC127860151 [Dreissena polymorpha]|uniref:uncharacterized protein LOC127860151 n=1 Tax=Dreissena polymorpha TaxID=45954 RepID=UPI002263DE3E|nr:uncharacterized protein LOC127860151 [Dreissena polymorpha]